MSSRRALWLLLTAAPAALLACNALLGIDPPHAVDGGADGAAPRDAASDAPAPTDAGDARGRDACSADLDADWKNCGRCGHDCGAPGTCQAGVCQPYAIAPTASFAAAGLAVGGGALFFTDPFDGTLDRCDLRDCAGTTTQIAVALDLPAAVVVTATNVYWGNQAGGGVPQDADALGTIAACGVAGCPSQKPQFLTHGVLAPQDLAVDTTSVYWTSQFGSVEKCSLPYGNDGGGSTVIASGRAGPLPGIAVDPTGVYWTEHLGGTVMKSPFADPTHPVTLAAGQSGPSKIAVTNGTVYWTNDSGKGSVMRCTATSCAPSLFASDLPGIRGLAYDAVDLYFSLSASDGKVLRCPLTGCTTPTVVADHQDTPALIAVHGDSVYWVTKSAIMRRVVR